MIYSIGAPGPNWCFSLRSVRVPEFTGPTKPVQDLVSVSSSNAWSTSAFIMFDQFMRIQKVKKEGLVLVVLTANPEKEGSLWTG